jgi:hypothetical protein
VIRTHNLLIRSQMLYPVELRVRNRMGRVLLGTRKSSGRIRASLGLKGAAAGDNGRERMSGSVWTGKIVNECSDTSLTVWKGGEEVFLVKGGG